MAAPTREAEYRQVQKQLLADVGSVRSRQKEALIKDQLRRNLVITRVIRPGYGEVVVYEHEFVNPFATEMVRVQLEHSISGEALAFGHDALKPSLELWLHYD